MGNFVGFTDTQFVGTEELGAVSSYQPCHVFGDSMLIGKGIRVGFYLLYIAAIIAVLFGVDKQFRIWNACWTLVALSTFISLVVNSSPQTLVVLDWAVLIQMVLWYPVFFFFQVFHRAVFRVTTTRAAATLDDVRARLALRCAVTELDAARARAYADVLKAFALHAAEVQVEGDYEASQARLRDCIDTFVGHWGATGPHGSVSVDAAVTVFHPELLAEVADAPTRQDVEALRDLYVAAMVRAGKSVAEARAVEAEVAALAAEELQIRRRTLAPRKAASYMLWGTAIKDKIAAALALIVWSVWMYATPNVWTRWRDYGRKDVCDGYVNLYFVFRAYNPWDDGFAKFLLIFACGAIPVAAVMTFIAFWLLTVGLFGRRGREHKTGRGVRRGRGRGRHGHGHGHAHDEEADHVREEDEVEVLRPAPAQSRFARCKHAEEILACIHDRAPRDSHHRYRRRAARPLHFNLLSIPYALILCVLLIYTIATVEVMLRNDLVDFVRPDLHETAEILVFLVGALLLVLVLWTVLEAFFQFLLRRRRGEGDHHHPHGHHRHHEKKEAQETHPHGSREELWKRGGPEHRQTPTAVDP